MRQLAAAGSQKTISSLASSIIIGKIVYGIQAWGGTTLENRLKLQKTINQSARIALGPRSYKMSVKSMMEILDWSSFGQLMDQHTLNLAISTVSNHKPISMFTKLNHFKLRMTCQSNEQTRIAPGWCQVKSCWSFLMRATSLLNNCPKSILTTKCKKDERSHQSAYLPDHIQLFNTHWSTVLTGSM